MTTKYEVGDRVLVTRPDCSLVNEPGTIVGKSAIFYYVEFDRVVNSGHDFSRRGIVSKTGQGLYIQEEEIMKEEVKMSKFNIGDKVMVRFVPDMMEEYGPEFPGANRPKVLFGFVDEMMQNCGKVFTIYAMNCGRISLMNDGVHMPYGYSDQMLMLVEKAKPKKKLTVAEIEKIVGYGVEIVKEGK